MSEGGRSAKRQKNLKQIKSSPAMDGPAVTMSRLTKHTIALEPELSPAAHHSNRVAVQATEGGDITAFFASGRRLYVLPVPPLSSPSAALGQRGKGGVFLPSSAPAIPPVPIPALTLRAEVQCLLATAQNSDGSGIIAAVDAFGRAVVAQTLPAAAAASGVELGGVHQLQPTNVGVEAGWAGISVASDQPSQAAIARHFPKDVTIFDGPLPVRTIHTMYRPNAVQLLSSGMSLDSSGGVGHLVAVAEGPQVSIWDVRAGEKNARVARMAFGPYSGQFYCLGAAPGGAAPFLGAAGEDRSVVVWDPRMWRTLDRWANCLKYEATSLSFLSSNPAYCLVCGMDYEAVCGRWGGRGRARQGGGKHRTTPASEGGAEEDSAGGGGVGLSFRGDSRWLGLGKAPGRDAVAGLTASKQLYVAELQAV